MFKFLNRRFNQQGAFFIKIFGCCKMFDLKYFGLEAVVLFILRVLRPGYKLEVF